MDLKMLGAAVFIVMALVVAVWRNLPRKKKQEEEEEPD